MSFYCSLCKYESDRKHNVKTHIERRHYAIKPLPTVKINEEKQHKCDKCEKTFSSLTYLNTHMLICDGPRKYTFECPDCNMKFKDSQAKYRHKSKCIYSIAETFPTDNHPEPSYDNNELNDFRHPNIAVIDKSKIEKCIEEGNYGFVLLAELIYFNKDYKMNNSITNVSITYNLCKIYNSDDEEWKTVNTLFAVDRIISVILPIFLEYVEKFKYTEKYSNLIEAFEIQRKANYKIIKNNIKALIYSH